MINKIWTYGTKKPVQRVGIIILGVGFLSLSLYSVSSPNYDLIDILFDPDYYARYSEPLFYKLYPYLLPLGLLMTWGYQVLLKIKDWILGEQAEERNIKNTPKEQENILFNNNLDAFDFASKMYNAALRVGQGNIGIVTNIVLTLDNNFLYTVKIADTNRDIFVYAVSKLPSSYISINSLVYWKFENTVEEKHSNIEAFGEITSTIKPQFNNIDKKWSPQHNLYNPHDIIQE